jgi:hypothetical protein
MFKIDNKAVHPIWRHSFFVNELQQLASIHFGLRRISSEEVSPSRGGYFGAIRSYATTIVGDHAALQLQDGTGVGDSPWQQFLTFQTTQMKSAAHYDALALFVLDDIFHGSAKTIPQKKNIAQLLKRYRLPAVFESYKHDEPNHEELALNIATGKTEGGDVFESSEIEYRKASVFLTRLEATNDGARNANASDYFIYRYSSIPGYIAKSVMRIYPTTQSDPRCRFENVFKYHDGSTRIASGNVFRREDWVYFMGVDDPARRPKCIVVRAIGHRPPPNGGCRGALLSFTRQPLVARCVLVQVEDTKRGATLADYESEVRVADEQTDLEFKAEFFAKGIGASIRNNVEFRAGFDILHSYVKNDKVILEQIDQATMVAEVGRRLKDEFLLQNNEGEPVPFNPAAHKHYPFNHAIVVPT